MLLRGKQASGLLTQQKMLCAAVKLFLKKNKDKKCRQMMPVFSAGKYKEYPHTEVRKLTPDEIKQYMSER